jgi:uncharacterized protein YaaQ
MKLVVAIVQDKDAGRAVDALVNRGYGATRITTVGGFLRRGNATILTGVPDAATPDVLRILRETAGTPAQEPGGVRTSGVAFVLPVCACFRM